MTSLLETIKLVAETLPDVRGYISSQGRCGCCQYRQVWWNSARGDVSSVREDVVSKQRTNLEQLFLNRSINTNDGVFQVPILEYNCTELFN